MIKAGVLNLRGSRTAPVDYVILFRGIDLTNADLHAQVRMRPDTPGDPAIDLPDGVGAGVTGLRLIGPVETIDGLPQSKVGFFIAEALMVGVPAAAELGDELVWSWDMQVTPSAGVKATMLAGAFVIGPAVTKSAIASTGSGAGVDAVVTVAESSILVDLSGSGLLGPLLASAAGDADRSEGAAEIAVAAAEEVAGFAALMKESEEPAFEIADDSNRVVLRITQDGTVGVGALAADQVAATGIIGDAIEVSNGPTFTGAAAKIIEIADSANRVIWDVDEAGHQRMVSAAIDAATMKTLHVGTLTADEFDLNLPSRRPMPRFVADILHIIHYGQSWAGGFDSIPALTTSTSHAALMFNFNAVGEGVRQQYSVAQDPTALQSFVPAQETNHTGSPEFTNPMGETGAVAMADEIKRLLIAENGLDPAGPQPQILVSFPGEGSKSIEQLADPAGIYMLRLIEQIQRGYAIAQAAGKTYAVLAVTWIQGSPSSGTPYGVQLEAMRAYIEAQAKATVPGQGDVPLVTWQQYPNTSTDLATNGSARGVYQRYVVTSADAYPHIYCSGPGYQYPQVSASNIHYRPEGMRDIGRDFGFAIKRGVLDGEAYEPLRIVSAKRQGKIAILNINAAAPIVSDTTQVATIANFGFNLYDAGGTLMTISSAQIVGPGQVRLLASATIPTGATLRYADTGTDSTDANKWRGTIRDDPDDGSRRRWLVAGSWSFDN